LLLFSFGGGHALFLFFFFYALWLEHTFFLCFLSIYSFPFFDDPSILLQDYKKRNVFDLWSIYFWWKDGMFCVTPGVGVSMYMWVYVISIMETWKDSTKGHNYFVKINRSQASICKRFEHCYQHMALVGNMTIEELALFYFQKEIIRDFTIFWDKADQLSHHIILVHNLDLVLSICFAQSFISGSCLELYQQIQKGIEHKDMHLVLTKF
jgi:hypothetical protein